MSTLVLSSDADNQFTSVSDIFIEEYLPNSNGEFVKLYIYLLKLLAKNSANVSVSTLADTFNQTEADIIRALRYWDKQGVLTLHFDGPDKQISGITINSLNRELKGSPQVNNSKASDSFMDSGAIAAPVSGQTVGVEFSSIIEPSKIQYSPEKLNELSRDNEFSELIYVIGTYLGHPLSHKETNSIVYFYDTLGFPSDLIIYLFEYCVEKGKNNLRYIEKVALSWAEQNISTVTQAKDEILNHSDVVYSVMSAFGIKNREPAKVEHDYIIKWSDSLGFSTDIIVEACNRTIKATHQPSFEYADSILTKWHLGNIRSSEDIAKADAIFKSDKSSKSKPDNVIKESANRFNNFSKRDKKSDDFYNSLLSNNN